MIVSLGQGVPYSYRMPFTRPAVPQPRLANTAFYSHIDPMRTMLPMAAFRPNMPRMPALIRPGIVSAGRGGPNRALPPMAPPGPAPDMNVAPPTVKGAFGFSPMYPGPRRGMMAGFGADAVGPADAAAPAAPAAAPAAPPAAMAAMARRRGAYSPYDSMNVFVARTMRTGVLPHIESSARGIRAGVAGAAGMINRTRWQSYGDRNAIPGTVDPSAPY